MDHQLFAGLAPRQQVLMLLLLQAASKPDSADAGYGGAEVDAIAAQLLRAEAGRSSSRGGCVVGRLNKV